MRKIIEFTTSQEARDYRHENGTGGWIFEPENETLPRIDCQYGWSILFPPDMAPIDIFRHPLTVGRSGRLIGAQ